MSDHANESVGGGCAPSPPEPCPHHGYAAYAGKGCSFCQAAVAAPKSEPSAPRDLFEESMLDPEFRRAFREEWVKDEAALAGGGAASRSEQSACIEAVACAEGFHDVHCARSGAYGRMMSEHLAAADSAAEAAQSPQEGAAHSEGLGTAVPRPLPALRRECRDNSPEWWVGRWRDWHRGHGCAKDDGQPVTDEGVAEFAKAGRRPGRSVSDRPPASESPGPLAALRELLSQGERYWTHSIACDFPNLRGPCNCGLAPLCLRIDAALRESSAERGREER